MRSKLRNNICLVGGSNLKEKKKDEISILCIQGNTLFGGATASRLEQYLHGRKEKIEKKDISLLLNLVF